MADMGAVSSWKHGACEAELVDCDRNGALELGSVNQLDPCPPGAAVGDVEMDRRERMVVD
jgi:hypothetical protein